jgi:hypothetical protein
MPTPAAMPPNRAQAHQAAVALRRRPEPHRPHRLLSTPIPWLGAVMEERLARAETRARSLGGVRPVLSKEHLAKVSNEVLANLRIGVPDQHLCLIGDMAVAVRLAQRAPWAWERGSADLDLLVNQLTMPRPYQARSHRGPSGDPAALSNVTGPAGDPIEIHWRRISGTFARLQTHTVATAERLGTAMPIARGEFLIALRLVLHPDALTPKDITDIRLLLSVGGVFACDVQRLLHAYASPDIAARATSLLDAIRPAHRAA